MERLTVQMDSPSNGRVFYQPIINMPNSFSAQDKARLKKLYRDAIANDVCYSYKTLRDFLKNEHLPKARASSGINAIINGKAIYNSYIDYHTSSHLTANDLHRLGLDENNN